MILTQLEGICVKSILFLAAAAGVGLTGAAIAQSQEAAPAPKAAPAPRPLPPGANEPLDQGEGRAVADEVSQRRHGIRVLFMSGFAQPILGAEVTSGANFRLVEKPFDEAKLLASVREVLDVDG